MAPLIIGRLDAPNDPTREGEWAAVASPLVQANSLGVEIVSVDVGWGAVERAELPSSNRRFRDRSPYP